MNYEVQGDSSFTMFGIHEEDSIWLKAQTSTIKDYRLTKRGIKWIRDLK